MNGNNKLASVENLMEKFHVYSDQGNNQKAKETLQTALEIQTTKLGDDHLAVAMILHHLGIVLKREGNSDEALESLNRALAIRVKNLGEKHFDTAKTYESIGRLFVEQGNHEKAEEMFQKAVDISLEILPHDDSDLMNLYQLLALSLQMQDKYSEATKIQKSILGTLLETHGEDHFAVVKSYVGIARLLVKENRFDDAHQMLDKSIEICSRLQALGDFDATILAGALGYKAPLLEVQGDWEGAMELFNKVIVIQQEEVGEKHRLTAQAYEALALAYVRRGMLEDAIKVYVKSITIWKTVLVNGHSKIKEVTNAIKVFKHTKALNEQGLAMKAQGDFEKAIQLFQEALNVCNKAMGDLHPHMAIVNENISSVKVEQGLLEDAIAASAEALKIRRRTLGDDHIDTKKRMEAHRSLLKRLLESPSYNILLPIE
ncbi:unnamed protein product [Cylindrotheca closterium]|uniref:Kinesin light chain n=1 Tax=Cylindrotheca closterium TaxID=2856 RepID=A0AAD2FP01_9STRA|nr:unnamed protein product [Cylindrotheca closterium]